MVVVRQLGGRNAVLLLPAVPVPNFFPYHIGPDFDLGGFPPALCFISKKNLAWKCNPGKLVANANQRRDEFFKTCPVLGPDIGSPVGERAPTYQYFYIYEV